MRCRIRSPQFDSEVQVLNKNSHTKHRIMKIKLMLPIGLPQNDWSVKGTLYFFFRRSIRKASCMRYHENGKFMDKKKKPSNKQTDDQNESRCIFNHKNRRNLLHQLESSKSKLRTIVSKIQRRCILGSPQISSSLSYIREKKKTVQKDTQNSPMFINWSREYSPHNNRLI